MWNIDEGEARTLLADLIAIDSVNPSLVPDGAGEQAAAEYVVDYLRRIGLPARLDTVAPGRPNAVGVLLPADAEPACDPFAKTHGLVLNGHLDTVSTEGMSVAPLRAQFDGDRVYGRGGYDMKGGLVMGLLAMAAVQRAGIPLRRSVLFTGVVDEEYMSIGTEDVVKRYRADAAVVMEPSSLTLTVAHKGFAWVTAEVFGHAAHGSSYREGVDAIAGAGRLVVEVDKLGRKYLQDQPHPLVGHRSIHASLIEGGQELSTYPGYCRVQFERRTLPGEDPAGIKDELDALCRQLATSDPGFRSELSLDFTRRGYEIGQDEPVVQALGRAVTTVSGERPEFTGTMGWLDSAVLGAAGIPTVVFGPDGAGAHSADEYVSFGSVIRGAKILAQVIQDLCTR